MVTVISQGAEKKDVDCQEDMTVGSVVEAAGFEMPEDGTVTVNGQDADENTPVTDNDKVVITPNIDNG